MPRGAGARVISSKARDIACRHVRPRAPENTRISLAIPSGVWAVTVLERCRKTVVLGILDAWFRDDFRQERPAEARAPGVAVGVQELMRKSRRLALDNRAT